MALTAKQKAFNKHAEDIANATGGFGFIEILIPIIAALLPVLINWFNNCRKPGPDVDPDPQPDDVPDNLSRYIQRRYRKGRYNPKLLKGVVKKAHEAAASKGETLTAKQATEVAIATLDKARTANTKELSAVMGA